MTTDTKTPKFSSDDNRLRIYVRGAVQGVGFRPFIYKLAHELGLNGWVSNSPQGVTIEVEGPTEKLRTLLLRIEKDQPPRAFIQSMESSYLDLSGHEKFEIRHSSSEGAKTAIIMPDIATCPDCLTEVFDPDNRRYLYPFTNCTNCGPRFSIIQSLPYDRPNTTMHAFTMCHDCRREYEDPLDRRFHAQPNACPTCGPLIELWDKNGTGISDGHEALLAAVEAVRSGKIVAVKGLGGFHLMADATNDEAVAKLRNRKHREEKPLGLMVSSAEDAVEICEVSDLEMRALTSPERPIVILKARHLPGAVSLLVAPSNPYLGCMLPYTPLHNLMMRELVSPIVATSGNLSDEPICIDEKEAVERLHGIADLFLVHDRPIARHVDDSIVRVMAGRGMVIRRARGFAPLPIPLADSEDQLLAVGAHHKNAVVAASGGQAYISQHIGDLETPQAYKAFTSVIESFQGLYGITPTAIACDEHPDYLSTRYALGSGILRAPVQHHYAHILSCMAENELTAPVLGVAWDGTGLGADGTIWGGEFLKITDSGYERTAHLRTFPLPGGDKASREPRRSAIGVLSEELGDHIYMMHDLDPIKAFDSVDLQLIKGMLSKDVNSPLTSSAGRLFDAVASMIGLRHFSHFEGQAAMELEFAIGSLETDERYEVDLRPAAGEPAVLDWGRTVEEVINDVESGVCRALIAARFHNAMVEAIIRVAKYADLPSVALSGGCFQNKYLLENTIRRLREAGFRPYWHQRVPTNDGGIALGQAFGAVRELNSDRPIAVKEMRRQAALCV